MLALCGWSNTQFSYWARRAEAVSVLAPQDRRLRAVARALERELKSAGVVEDSVSPEGEGSSNAMGPGGKIDDEGLEEEWLDMYVTGKGLDSIIEEVKRRTGASQFLRGRHSSLDPFNVVPADSAGSNTGPGSNAGAANGESGKRRKDEALSVYVPTFQADLHAYAHPLEREETKAVSVVSVPAPDHDQKRKAQTLEVELDPRSETSVGTATTNTASNAGTTATMSVTGAAIPTTWSNPSDPYNATFQALMHPHTHPISQTHSHPHPRSRHAHSHSLPHTSTISTSNSTSNTGMTTGQPFLAFPGSPSAPARRVSFDLSDSRSPTLSTASLGSAGGNGTQSPGDRVHRRSIAAVPEAQEVQGLPAGSGLPPRKKRRSM